MHVLAHADGRLDRSVLRVAAGIMISVSVLVRAEPAGVMFEREKTAALKSEVLTNDT